MIRILLVDDEPALLDIARIFIERDPDLKVTTVPSAFDALKILSEDGFDVIISDYEMPAMDGIEFLKKIRSDGNRTPFIIFTGRGRERVVIEALNFGADFYLQKGGDPKSQFAELRNMVHQAAKRIAAEEARSRSEKQLFEIINFLPDATFAIDRAGLVIAWNRAIEEMTGVPASEMLGKGNCEYSIPFYGERRKILIDMLFEEDDETPKKYYPEMVRNGHGIIAETEVPHLKKGPVIVWAKATPFYDNNMKVVGAVESIRDITELRQYEQSILGWKNRFHDITDLLPLGIFEIDSAGNVLYANKRAFEIFRFNPGEGQAGLNIFNLLVPGEHARVRQKLSMPPEMLSEEEQVYTAIRSDGSEFSLRVYSSPIIQDGKVMGIRGIIRNLDPGGDTPGFSAVQGPAGEPLLDTVPDGILVVDWEGKILFANQKIPGIFGIPAGTANGRIFFEFIKTEDLRSVRYQLSKQKEGHPLLGEYRVIGPEGTVRWIEGRGSTITFQGQSAALLVIRDISGIKESEERIRSAEAEIRHRSALLDLAKADLSVFSHALQNILEISSVTLEVERVSYWTCDRERKGISCGDLYIRSLDTHEHGAFLDARRYPEYFGGLSEKREIIADITQEHPITRELCNEYLRPLRITSMMDIPVWHNGYMIGILCHEHTGPARKWTAREQEFARSVADTISLALETSQRHEIEEILRESETTTRALLDATHEAAVLMGADGRILKINAVAANWVGVNLDDAQDQNLYTLVEEPYARLLRENVRAAIECASHISFEYEWNGRTIESTIIPIADPGSNTSKIGLFGRDVTNSRAYALALEEREKFLNNLFLNFGDGISILDRDMRIIRANPVIEAWFPGNTPLTGKKCYEVYSERDRPCTSCPVIETIRDGNPHIEIVRRKGRDGTFQGWLELHSYPFIDIENGQMTGVIEYIRDITAQKEAEETLKESEERYKTLFEGAGDGILILDTKGFINCNRRTEIIYGRTRDQLIGHSPVDFSPECQSDGQRSSEKAQEKIRAAYAGEPQEFVWDHTHPDGSIFSVEVSLIRIPVQETYYLQAIVRDITNRKRGEDDLRLANRRLQLLNSITRHDLLNQLTIIDGAFDLLQEEVAGEKEQPLANMIRKAIATMKSQINFTRDYQNIGMHEPVWQDLEKTISHAISLLHTGHVRIDVNVGKIRVLADPMLEKVFYNLVDNALRYGGEPLTTVQILACEEESGLVIIVEDDGIGITRKDKPKIFERGVGQNTGLGLFLVKEILSITGIGIRENGDPGKGAKFEILVPRGDYSFEYCLIP